MSKISYLVKASDDALTIETATVLMAIARKNFITMEELEEALPDLNVEDSVESLLDSSFVESSGDGFVISGATQSIFADAAQLYAAEQKPELVKERRKRQPRGTTTEMVELCAKVMVAANKVFDVKNEIEVDRSNMAVCLVKRSKSGVRKLQVQHKGNFRIIGYKFDKKILEELVQMGMTFRESSYGNIYIDMPGATIEDIQKIIEVIA